MKYTRSHPINIFEHTSKYLVLLLFPLLRACWSLLVTHGNLYDWLRGTWFDILTVLVIAGMGFLAWFRYLYALGDEGIFIRKGIFLVKQRFLPYRKLSVVSVERPWYLLPFRAVRIHADTDGGLPTVTDFSATIHRDEVDKFLRRANRPFINKNEIRRVYLPKNLYIALLSVATSNSLTGVLFVSTVISTGGRVLGAQFETQMMHQLTAFAQTLAAGIPPAAALIAFTILGGWLVSFCVNLVRHLRFSTARQSGILEVKSGLITRREYSVTVSRINLIELRQTLLTRLFGFYSAFIHANGYGKQKDELSVLMPSGESHSLARNMELLLPEIPICKPTIRPRLKYLSRFLIPPLGWIAGVGAVWILCSLLFPAFGDLILCLGLMAEIPCVWYLFVKIYSFFHTGVGKMGNTYTFCYTYGYRIKTVAVPKKRIVKLTIRRSWFQIISGCCDLVVLTFSEGMKRHVIPNLNYEEAKAMMESEAYCREKQNRG
jgi:putative membrane protein